jgi:voltage-dependent calcium channel L type alpha-1D
MNFKVMFISSWKLYFLFVLQDNSLRVFCHWLQGHPVMGNFILVCIIISSALLACEDPLRASSEVNVVII